MTSAEVDAAAGPTGICTIVLADDMPDIRFLLRISLEGVQGFEIVGEASNGQEAIEVVARHKPDVILLDISMPVLDGLEAIPGIKQGSPDTKIVVLTGFESEETYRHAMELGAHSYLHKSVALTDISGAVWDVCRTGIDPPQE